MKKILRTIAVVTLLSVFTTPISSAAIADGCHDSDGCVIIFNSNNRISRINAIKVEIAIERYKRCEAYVQAQGLDPFEYCGGLLETIGHFQNPS